MKTVEGLNYRQWQKRNTERFKALPREQQQEARARGYRNIGWDKVREAWGILTELTYKVLSLKQGDLEGAINQSLDILYARLTKYEQLAEQALAKYETL